MTGDEAQTGGRAPTDPGRANGYFLDTKSAVPRLIVESRLALLTALQTFDLERADVLERFGRLSSISEVDANQEPEVLALWLLNAVARWDDQVAAGCVDLPDLMNEGAFDSWAPETALSLVRVVSCLARLQLSRELSDELQREGARAFHAAARLLKSRNHTKAAFQLASISHSWVAMSCPDVTWLCKYALRLALELDAREESALIAAKLVAAMSSRGAPRLELYDRMEHALLLLERAGDARETACALLGPVLRENEFLRPLLAFRAGPFQLQLEPSSPPPEAPGFDLGLLHAIEIDASPEELAQATPLFSLGLVVDNRRISLAARPPLDHAETSWTSWTFEHPSLWNAVPHSQSVLRDEERDQLLLTVCHETTHVCSMMSYVGLALMALRAAAFDRECTLRTFEPQQRFDFSQIDTLGPGCVQLHTTEVLALAQAEQLVELLAKTRALAALWAPWFEGIALFNELSDPTTDTHQSRVVTATSQLVDVIRKEIPSNFDAEVALTEARLADAVGAAGAPRFRACMVRYRQKYLVGYLAVRAVVASWRRRVPALTQGQAARCLLSLTEILTRDALCDLGLPLAKFVEGCSRGLSTFAQSLADIDPSELALLMQGQLSERLSALVDTQAQTALLGEWSEQALRSLTGERAEVGRVPAASEECQAVMDAIANGLASAPSRPDDATRRTILRALQANGILPVGAASCRFWVARRSRTLLCNIRTTMRLNGSGEPSYDLVMFSLDEASFALLEQQIALRREPRIAVTRVINLSPDALYPPGVHYIVFSYGDWWHIQPRGQLTGATRIARDTIDAIRGRLQPDAMLLYEQAVASGKSVPNLIEWLDRADEWHFESDSLDVGAWRDAVAASCRRLDDWSSLQGLAGAELAEFVFGRSATAAEVVQNGLDGVREMLGSSHLNELIKALYETAREPQRLDWLDAHFDELDGVLGGLFERDESGAWDVCRPRGGQRASTS